LRSYELMYILDPKLDEDGSKALLVKIEELMSKQGVEIEKTESWGKRRLAYAIKGNWEGKMERRLRVTEGVLRFITVRTDEQQAKLDRRKARGDEKSQARRQRKAAKRASESEKAPAPEAAEAAPSAASTDSAE